MIIGGVTIKLGRTPWELREDRNGTYRITIWPSNYIHSLTLDNFKTKQAAEEFIAKLKTEEEN